MNNEMQWSSATPGLLIILLDQSGSMLSSYENETRTIFATKAVNRVIDTIIQKNFDGRAPKNRCFISVIGYNHRVKNLVQGYLKELDEHPIRVETVKQKINDGAGGILEIDRSMPIWVDPIKENSVTNMKGAFEMAEEIIKQWISDKPNNPAPVIINISDGVPFFDGMNEDRCMELTIEIVNRIKSIDTKDGKIQIFNAMIGNGAKTMFPSSESELKDKEAKFLYEISTEIPASYKGAAEKNGFSYNSGARGLICQCDGVELIGLIDFGSSKGQGDRL
ncbi:MAG: vWA domain-containing protein [Holdemanella porci]